MTHDIETNERQATNAKTTKTSKSKTFTTSDYAREHDMNAKTLRARIRRNIDQFATLFHDNQRHVFRDNATTRKKIDAILNNKK